MKKHDKINLIIAAEGMLLTQAKDVASEERIFSSRVYDDNLDNWVEWTLEEVVVDFAAHSDVSLTKA